ncbi:thiol:disulfide interchange protein DsbA/DsbL [Castellaniella caeni]|uniref:thiol:disulfide interchange protein DsbA/DsbL n=1 Tax=Castellaniella caeni TaxID=266123 RepID=UPI00082C358D|nr:thiol:disulfide interchange protein DsbA/DsbL [Castellaniella caeni]
MIALISRFASGLLLGLAALAMAPAQAASYTTLDPAQPSDTPGKVEVLEFFSYSCPHCAKIEPLVEKWLKTIPSTVVFKGVPVAFNASMRDQQKLYYTLEALGRLDLHGAVFKAIHEEGKDLFKADAIADWVATQGVDRKAFMDAFNSFGVQTKVARADELTQAYKIDGTPSFAVGGKFVTSPAQTGTYQGAIDETDTLVKQILSQGIAQ